MKYKIQRGFIPPTVDLQNPNAPMATAYELYSKKIFSKNWEHIETFESRFDAECYLFNIGAKYDYTYAERWLV